MDKFLEFLKKSIKWIALGAIGLLLIVGLIGFGSWSYDEYMTSIDEEVGLKCKSEETNASDGFIRVILGSTKRSRATDKYWRNIRIATYDKSKIFDDKKNAYFRNYYVLRRNIDYVVADGENWFGETVMVWINRENYNLKIMVGETTYEESCEVVDVKEIYDYVDKISQEAQNRNNL